jgi:hypothetical protein
MNEQQLAAVKQALEALMVFRYAPPAQRPLVLKAIADLEQVIAQDALYKMAEDAVTIGLSYNDWPKIGCVNHDCDKCKAVQEPVAQDVQEKCRIETVPAKGGLLPTPPAPQPAPVKTYHDGKPWPIAPKPWVGLTDEERSTIESEVLMRGENYPEVLAAIEAKLKEKNT